MPWWRHYFDEAFFRLHEPLFPEEESRREAGAILELMGLPAGARILDAPCGWGRHTVLFGEAGVEAFGADLSVTLLERAARALTAAGSPIRLAAADLRALPFRDGVFDGVANVFTSLGLFVDDAEDLRALREARRVLRPGGRFLLETMHRDEVIAAYAERDAWTLPDGTQVEMRRRFDPVSGVSREVMRWRRGSQTGEKRHALRLRTATEIDALLRAAGFDDSAGRTFWRHLGDRVEVLHCKAHRGGLTLELGIWFRFVPRPYPVPERDGRERPGEFHCDIRGNVHAWSDDLESAGRESALWFARWRPLAVVLRWLQDGSRSDDAFGWGSPGSPLHQTLTGGAAREVGDVELARGQLALAAAYYRGQLEERTRSPEPGWEAWVEALETDAARV